MAAMDYRKTKLLLFMQSFSPLFFLLAIRHFNIKSVSLVRELFLRLLKGDYSAIRQVLSSSDLWSMIVVFVSLVWVAGTAVYMLIFKKMQLAGFSSLGEKIEEIDYHDDVGLNFFASYLLPLIVDIDGLQDFLVFVGMLVLILLMVWRSNLYYENPALTLWRYRTFSFKTDSGVKGIGITRGRKKIDLDRKIKRKQIMDGLYFIYNDPAE